jgi:addiction module HigA family antidote
MTKLMAPVHPGEILKEEFMRPLSLSANALARAVRVPPNRISAIVNAERGLTADTALRLAKAFGTTAEFWLTCKSSMSLIVRATKRPTSGASSRFALGLDYLQRRKTPITLLAKPKRSAITVTT